MNRVLLALFLAAGALAHAPPLCADDPICPNIPTVANFDINRFAGSWYELGRSQGLRTSDLICVTSTYTVIPENGTMLMVHRGYNTTTRQRHKMSAISTVSLDPTQASKFSMEFFNNPTQPKRAHWILETDYNTYALVYTCSRASGTEVIWLMTRDQHPAKEVIRRLGKATRDRSFKSSDIDITLQAGCTYPRVVTRSTLSGARPTRI